MSIAETTPRRALHNFGFSAACKVVAGLSGFVVSVIIARSLGASEMGTYSFVIWVAGTITAFSSLGLPDAVARYVAEHKGAGSHVLAAKIARATVAIQIVAAGTVSVIGAGVWSAIARNDLTMVLLALSTVMPAALQQVLLALLEGEQRFDLQFISALGGAIFQIGIVAAFALHHASIHGFLLANLLSSVALTGLTVLLCRPMLNSHSTACEHPVSAEMSRRIFNF